MNFRRIGESLTPCRLRTIAVIILGLASMLVLGGIQPITAADSAPSQCVACHTDAAKLKPLTPPDPPSAEEGEG
jgi:hypothetical protein